MTFKELTDKFTELEITPDFLATFYNDHYESYGDDDASIDDDGNVLPDSPFAKKTAFLDSLGKREDVYREGDTEGGGDTSMKVIKFAGLDFFICITGYYYSENGTTWDEDILQVFPRRVINTVYETEEVRGDKKDEV